MIITFHHHRIRIAFSQIMLNGYASARILACIVYWGIIQSHISSRRFGHLPLLKIIEKNMIGSFYSSKNYITPCLHQNKMEYFPTFELELPNPHLPVSIEFNSFLICGWWIIFQPFSTQDILLASRFSISIFMSDLQANSIPWFHQ